MVAGPGQAAAARPRERGPRPRPRPRHLARRDRAVSLGSSLADVLDLDDDDRDVPAARVDARAARRRRRHRSARAPRAERLLASDPAARRGRVVLATTGSTRRSTRRRARARPRVRPLARALPRRARRARDARTRSSSTTRGHADEREHGASGCAREAEAQLELLRGGERASALQSDFYSYRYFASEGFLPGYSFPRLPLSAFIPARRGTPGQGRVPVSARASSRSRSSGRAASSTTRAPATSSTASSSRRARRGEPARRRRRSSSARAAATSIRSTDGDPGLDMCEHVRRAARRRRCTTLFRLQNVATKRRDRINSDEEERVRLGFEIRTGVRFAERDGRGRRASRTSSSDGDDLGHADLRRRRDALADQPRLARRKNPNQLGFVLDTERGYWARNDAGGASRIQDDPMSPAQQRVDPVRRGPPQRAALRARRRRSAPRVDGLAPAALKNAIQVAYELEDSELAVEPLPNRDYRRLLLFYEAAEGGAGVLRRLATDPDALAAGRPRGARALPLRPRDRRGPRHAPRRARGLRGRLLRLPAELREPVRPRHARPPRVRDVLLLPRRRRRSRSSPGSLPRARALRAAPRALRLRARAALPRLPRRARATSCPTHAPGARRAARAHARTSRTRDHYAVVFVDGPPHDYARRRASATARRRDGSRTPATP